MSPRRMTRLGVMIGAISVLGIMAMALSRPDVGLLAWWPAAGLGLAFMLFVAAYAKGAYMVAQRRVELVDRLNDCYNGVPERQNDKKLHLPN